MRGGPVLGTEAQGTPHPASSLLNKHTSVSSSPASIGPRPLPTMRSISASSARMRLLSRACCTSRGKARAPSPAVPEQRGQRQALLHELATLLAPELPLTKSAPCCMLRHSPAPDTARKKAKALSISTCVRRSCSTLCVASTRWPLICERFGGSSVGNGLPSYT